MKHTRIDPLRAVLIAVISLAVTGMACSATPDESSPDPAGTAATNADTVIPSATPAGDASAGDASTEDAASSSNTSASDADLIERGAEIFRTAGGVGCQSCHGPRADGEGEAGLGAPNIRGAQKVQIQGALNGGVPLMSFIKLSSDEVDAVTAYLQSLAPDQ